MDRISIRDFDVDCILGIMPVERRERQRIRINLDLFCDLSTASRTDDIADTLDYKMLRDTIQASVMNSRFFLIEGLAASVADLCLEYRLVRAVRVTIDKPGALTGARSVAVSLVRRRGKSCA